MKKICPECLNVYVGFADIETCPIHHCEGLPLVVVDDLYVDVVKGFLRLCIRITRFDAGTLDEDSSGPLVCFADTWYEGTPVAIDVIQELAMKVNDGTVIVSEVRQYDGFRALFVKSKCDLDDENPITQLEFHVAFVKYLYRLLDELAGKRDLLFKMDF
jgi:hypothetical protein